MDQSAAVPFALYYGIMYGAIIRRLAPWSPFAPHFPAEPRWQVFRRLGCSWALLQMLPALYFAVALWLLLGRHLPTHSLPRLMVWTCALSFSALIIPGCYRLWISLMRATHWHPTRRAEDTQPDTHLVTELSFGAWNGLFWASVSLLAGGIGFVVLYLASRP